MAEYPSRPPVPIQLCTFLAASLALNWPSRSSSICRAASWPSVRNRRRSASISAAGSDGGVGAEAGGLRRPSAVPCASARRLRCSRMRAPSERVSMGLVM